MADFSVWIVAPVGDTAWQCLQEFAVGIAHSLRRLGHNCDFGYGPTPPTTGRLIVFNAHRLPPNTQLPENAIIYNAEQAQVDGQLGDAWRASDYIRLCRQHEVLTYSEAVADRLRALGVERVSLCPVGFYPELRTGMTSDKDVDVLFVGSISDRRKKVLYDIARRRLKTQVLFGSYGKERDAWIARSKVVLNVHFYPQPVWEIFRVSHLLANQACVVTEDGGVDPALETLAAETCAVASYDKLAELCASLVSDADRRAEVARLGAEKFEKLDQVEYVRAALAAAA